MPDLDFEILGAEVLKYVAAPTLLFKLHIQNSSHAPAKRQRGMRVPPLPPRGEGGYPLDEGEDDFQNQPAEEQIQAILLRVQIRIEALRRKYSEQEKARLLELFGEPSRWRETVRTLLWTQTTASVPPFTGECVAELPVVCTYDFDVVGAKYLYALENGEVPLLFLFSGTVLYTREEAGVQVAQIPWEKEASFRLPIRLWQETMDHYFPNSAWMRVRKDVYDRLYAFKSRNALLTWEDALERLLDQSPSA